MAEESSEIAMKLNLGDWFFKHMDRISETTSKIEEPGQTTNFKMEVLLLEASLWAYIEKSGKPDYYKKIEGYEDLLKERETLKNRLTANKLGTDGVRDKEMSLDVKESLMRIKGLMKFAVDQNIAPGYKPPEKRFGMDPKKSGPTPILEM